MELINPKEYINEMTEWRRKNNTNIFAMQLGKDCLLDTLEGTMTGRALDYLVKGTVGEFYIVKKDIFEGIYESVYHESI